MAKATNNNGSKEIVVTMTYKKATPGTYVYEADDKEAAVTSLYVRKNKIEGDQPMSITPEDVLGPHGLLAGMEDVRAAGLVDHFGLTGIGDAQALRTVMQSRRFATIQAPFHLLNPSALLETLKSIPDV